MNNKKILLWELIGVIAIASLGTLLHFCFEWSGYYKPLALFCAVNESVWEHLKIAFWPAFLFCMIEYFFWGWGNKNFLAAKTLSLYLIPVFITVAYYLYTSILGTHILIIDIAIFLLSILAGQLMSYCILTSGKDYSKYYVCYLILILIITVAFSLFTYYPIKLDIFKDPRNGTYGIP